MTTPNAAEEFMHSLDQHPEIEQELRRRLLTQELLDLPNTVGTLATVISEMRDIFDHRLTSLESQQSENTEQLNSIQQTLNTLDGRVANTTGSDYERRATRRVPSLLSRYLRLSRIQALHSPLQETAPFLVEMINNALTAHDITDSEKEPPIQSLIEFRNFLPCSSDAAVPQLMPLGQADRQKWFCPITKPSLAAARPVDPGSNGLRRSRANPVLAGAAHRAHGLGGRAAVLHRDRFHVG